MMGFHIKNPLVGALASEVAILAGETRTEAIRKALEERRSRLVPQIPNDDRGTEAMRFLETEVWPRIPAPLLGRGVTKREREKILGYGDPRSIRGRSLRS